MREITGRSDSHHILSISHEMLLCRIDVPDTNESRSFLVLYIWVSVHTSVFAKWVSVHTSLYVSSTETFQYISRCVVFTNMITLRATFRTALQLLTDCMIQRSSDIGSRSVDYDIIYVIHPWFWTMREEHRQSHIIFIKIDPWFRTIYVKKIANRLHTNRIKSVISEHMWIMEGAI